MLKNYLDEEIYKLITSNFSFNDITEIRMRANQRIVIVIKNKKYYLKDNNQNFVVVKPEMLQSFIKRITQNSIYAYNDQIVDGYISLPNGIRVGVAGEVVSECDKVLTIKNFQSVNIRIPHIVKNCSLLAYDFLVDNGIKNCLILSSPGSGKTTFIRDFIYQLHSHNVHQNILLVDERNEICSFESGSTNLDMGGFCDIYTNCSKQYAFNNGIRSMRPDVIVTDELNLEKDIESVINAINCGVNVVATIHAKDIEQLRAKKNFSYILEQKFFSRFVVLTSDESPGTIAKIYDEKLNCIYCR